LATIDSGLGTEVRVKLAVFWSLGAPCLVEMTQKRKDSLQELVDQFLLIAVSGGACHAFFIFGQSGPPDGR